MDHTNLILIYWRLIQIFKLFVLYTLIQQEKSNTIKLNNNNKKISLIENVKYANYKSKMNKIFLDYLLVSTNMILNV